MGCGAQDGIPIEDEMAMDIWLLVSNILLLLYPGSTKYPLSIFEDNVQRYQRLGRSMWKVSGVCSARCSRGCRFCRRPEVPGTRKALYLKTTCSQSTPRDQQPVSHLRGIRYQSCLLIFLPSALPLVTMGGQRTSAQELFERAQANGYKPGAHEASDRLRKKVHYAPKTLRDQDKILIRYQKSVSSLTAMSPGSLAKRVEMGRNFPAEVRRRYIGTQQRPHHSSATWSRCTCPRSYCHQGLFPLLCCKQQGAPGP